MSTGDKRGTDREVAAATPSDQHAGPPISRCGQDASGGFPGCPGPRTRRFNELPGQGSFRRRSSPETLPIKALSISHIQRRTADSPYIGKSALHMAGNRGRERRTIEAAQRASSSASRSRFSSSSRAASAAPRSSVQRATRAGFSAAPALSMMASRNSVSST